MQIGCLVSALCVIKAHSTVAVFKHVSINPALCMTELRLHYQIADASSWEAVHISTHRAK